MAGFPEKLKVFRVGRHEFKNSKEFYAALGVSQPTGSRYESGETEPPISFLEKLIEQFQGDAKDLLPTTNITQTSGMKPGEAAQRASSIVREIKAAAPHLRETLSDQEWDFVLGGVAQILSIVPEPAIAESLRQLLVTIAKGSKKKKTSIPERGE